MIVLTLLAVVVLGLVNGGLIAYVEIPAMLATLASAMVIRGFFRFAVLRGEYLLLLPTTNLPVVLFSREILPGLTYSVALTIAVLALTWFLLRRTTFGRITYAMGDNCQAARLTGLPVRTTTLMIYVYAALTALLAGLVTAASSGTVDFRTVTNGSLLFEVILVVVLRRLADDARHDDYGARILHPAVSGSIGRDLDRYGGTAALPTSISNSSRAKFMRWSGRMARASPLCAN